MSVSDANTVDAVGIEPDTGNALMIVSDDMDWSDIAGHINALQQKIGAYIAFIQSGQLDNSLPEGVGRPRKIGVIQQFEPPEIAVQILDQLGEQLSTFSIDFAWGPLPDGYEQPG
jgi:hypothetical protein